MSLLWHLVCFLTFAIILVQSDTIKSNPTQSEERDDGSGSHQLIYESNGYPTQSMVNSNNGYDNNQNSMSLSESNNAQIYSTGHQPNDQYDQNERKTLILAIPVKLKLPNSKDNYDQSPPQSEGEGPQSQSLLYSKGLPYPHINRQPLYSSSNSDDSDPNESKSSALLPLSHKIYSSIDSQLKSASYSTVNTQKSVSEQPSSHSSNEHKYKNSYETKDHKLSPNQYEKDVNTNRNYPIAGEYKGISFKTEGVDDDYETVDNRRITRPNLKSGQTSGSYDSDSYESRIKQKENSKQLYESVPNNKPEYDYESAGEDDEEEEDDRKVENIFYNHKDYRNNKNGHNLKNIKNQFKGKPIAPKPNMNSQFHHSHKGLGLSLPVYSSEPFDGWPQYYYSKPLMNVNNDWSGMSMSNPETVDTNLLNLFSGFKINKPAKEGPRSPLYAPAFDLLGDSQLKAASNPIPVKTLQNSKIYGQAAKYQSSYPTLNLFAGQPFNIPDYSLLDINGDLYPAPLVGQTPPIQHRPLKQKESMAEYNSGNRDSIKPHRRNPLLLRPSFMSGLRSAASKPLANYSPFASASTTQSFLSVLPSLQTSFNINAKSIPRQIFPLLYG